MEIKKKPKKPKIKILNNWMDITEEIINKPVDKQKESNPSKDF
jgi:hypothetical protein